MTQIDQIRALRSVHRMFAAILALMALATAYMIGPRLVQHVALDRTPPVVAFTKVEVQNSPIRAGDALLVRVWRDKVRDDCPVTATRTALDVDGRVHAIERVTWQGGSDQDPYIDLAYYIPAHLNPGAYVLQVALIYACPGDLHYSYQQPPAPFRLSE